MAGRLNLSIDIYAFSHGVFARIADARADCQAVVQPARSRIHHPNAGRHGADMREAQIGKEIMREGGARFAPREIDVAASEVIAAFDFPTAHLGGVGHIAEHAYRIAVAADRFVDGATLYTVVPTDIKLVLDDIVFHAVVEITDFQVEGVVRFPDALFVDVEADVAVERRFALQIRIDRIRAALDVVDVHEFLHGRAAAAFADIGVNLQPVPRFVSNAETRI